ncbi:MAG: S8 family serine peptidase, partial [Saprospiraceae bacterium]|nr:S8 family serine peptidase [Saprospiraceae bacterium]
WDGTSADHNYNWHDAIHEGHELNCPPDSPAPCDESFHGTYVMAIAVGDDGANNQIGVAPAAQWIGCRAWEPIQRTDISYLSECLQWMIAPTDLNDENPDPSMAPDVLNNSWVCEPDEGCVDPSALQTIIENVRASGIVVLGGAGNNGPACGSSQFPPSIYEQYFSVAATTIDDTIAWFSSRGPIVVDGSGRRKPDISAPGENIRSAEPGGTYTTASGTSAAGPHVAGLVALLISANPDLAGHVDRIEQIITETAAYLETEESCGGIPGTDVPNNTFGYGRIDAFAAYLETITTTNSEITNVPQSRTHTIYSSPNPFKGSTVIRYQLGQASDVYVSIYDVMGRHVRTLVDGEHRAANTYQLHWDGRNGRNEPVASGIYFAWLRTDAGSMVLKMIRAR